MFNIMSKLMLLTPKIQLDRGCKIFISQ